MSTFNPSDHLGFLTNRVGRLIAQAMAEKLEEMNYTFQPSCLGVLGDLWTEDGLTQKELGISTIKTKSSISHMLTALEEEDLIIRISDPEDKRNKKIFLTQKGKDLQAIIDATSLNMEHQFIGQLPKEDVDIAKKVLLFLYNSILESKHNITDNNE